MKSNPGNYFCLACLLLLGLCCQSQAIILYGKDNSANTSDPGTGVPWQAVGKVTNNSGTSVTGSAIYLGSDWVLTANHVTVGGSNSYITFNGSGTYEIDTGQIFQVAPNVDMKVMKLKSTPSVTPVTLLGSGNETLGANATHVGWGVGRDPSVPTGNQTVAWGVDSTSAKRWGINRLYDFVTISYGTGNYTAIRTILGASDGPGGPFNPDGVGDDESAATLYDSGSGLFEYLDSTWYLVGLTTGVQVFGSSFFADDSTVLPANEPGHGNYFVRISSYESAIQALIPEPQTGALLAMAAAGWALAVRRRCRATRPAAVLPGIPSRTV